MIIKEYDIGSNYQRNSWDRNLKQGKTKAEFSNERTTEQYVNYLKSKGIDAYVYPYTLGGDITYIVDIDRHKSVNNEGLNRINKLKEAWIDDDEFEDEPISYEAKAFYQKNWRGLADDAKFTNIYELREWVLNMIQSGLYVEVYDYEDDMYRYYAWPENAEYLDLTDVDELEIDEQGNFLYIDGTI